MIRRLCRARYILPVLALTLAEAPPRGPAPPLDVAWAAGRRPAHTAPGPAQDPCAASSLELSSPRGTVLQSSHLTLRWRSMDRGPYTVTVTDPSGQAFYRSTTFGHELRLLVSPGQAVEGRPQPPQLQNGGTYRWRVVPEFAPNPQACPTAEFRLLDEERSKAAAAKFAAAAERLGVEDESRELEARLELARLYEKEGFYAEAEQELARLGQRGYKDRRIAARLRALYRETDRPISRQSLDAPADSTGPF